MVRGHADGLPPVITFALSFPLCREGFVKDDVLKLVKTVNNAGGDDMPAVREDILSRTFDLLWPSWKALCRRSSNCLRQRRIETAPLPSSKWCLMKLRR